MAVFRDDPYSQFNFLVNLGDADADSIVAGFAEVRGLDVEVDVVEYRTGNSRVNEPRKLTGLTRVGNVTLKRGVIGTLAIWEWFEQVRAGAPDVARDVTIELLNEDRTATVLTWKLERARPVRYVSGPLDANGSDLAIEKLVLSYERLEIE